MSLSLILAVTLMPLVIVLLLLGLAITWLRMRRAAHDDVVDLVAMRKPVTPDPNYELRTSTEPFPYLPPVSVDNSRMSMDAAFIRKKDFGDFTRCTHHPTEPPVTTDDSLTTPTKRISILSESPSSEALAAFDFDTPSKPPVPQRSLKRSSGRSLHSVPTPIIKIEPASPSNPSLLFPQPDNQPLHLSPIAIGRAHARQTIEAISAHADSTTPPPVPSSFSNLFSKSVPLSHINNPTADNLPPTPARTSSYLPDHTLPTPPLSASQFPPTPFNTPANANEMALRANRSMMEIEARLAASHIKDRKELTAIEVSTLLGGRKTPAKNMQGKRNSAIREYVRGFPEGNPWRRLMRTKGSRDLGNGVVGSKEEGDGDGEESFVTRFGGEGVV